MKDDLENDALWELLGHARTASVSPYFSRRVLRDIRLSPAQPLLPPILLRWLAAGSLAVLTAGFCLNLDSARSGSGGIAGFGDFNQTFDAIAGIDTLVAVEAVSVLDYSTGL